MKKTKTKGLSFEKLVVILVVIALAGEAATYYTLLWSSPGRAATVISVSTSTLTVTRDVVGEVRNSYLTYLHAFKSENATAVVARYADNATLVWETYSGLGMGGGGAGASQIRQLYDQVFFFEHTSINFANESYAISILRDGNEAEVNANLTIYGDSNYPVPGVSQTSSYVGNAVISIRFLHTGNQWLISHESWTYIKAYDGCQSLSSPPCSTLLTSPEWVSK